MSNLEKISPTFTPFLADSGPDDKRDAIVVFRSPKLENPPPLRGRLRALKQRLDYIKEQAASQKSVQAKLFENYQQEGAKHLSSKHQELAVSPIGGTQLPVAEVEVTPSPFNMLPISGERRGVLRWRHGGVWDRRGAWARAFSDPAGVS